jgi:hypothetical protein
MQLGVRVFLQKWDAPEVFLLIRGRFNRSISPKLYGDSYKLKNLLEILLD